MGFLNLLNIKTFSSSKRFLNGGCEKSWGWGRHLEAATKNLGQYRGSIFVSRDRKKNHVRETKGKILNWKVL